jgi:hypothetical protein
LFLPSSADRRRGIGADQVTGIRPDVMPGVHEREHAAGAEDVVE